MISKKDIKCCCPDCHSDITDMANWETLIKQQHNPIYCQYCHTELILDFEEFLGEAEEYIEFYFYRAKDYDV